MSKMRIKRRGEQKIQDNGIWGGVIAFQCPWAHPAWSEYLLLVFDLNSTAPDGKEPVKRDPSATHEFMIFAVDPSTPIDYAKSPFDQKSVSPLTPANHGYQFVAETNADAWDRVNDLVDACYRQVTPGVFALNPDTDFRVQWDKRMVDGWTLRLS